MLVKKFFLVFSLLTTNLFANEAVKWSGTFIWDNIYSDRDKTGFSSGANLRKLDLNLNVDLLDDLNFNVDVSFAGKVDLSMIFLTYKGIKNTAFIFGQIPNVSCLENSNSSKWVPFLERSLVATTFQGCFGPGVGVSHWSDLWAIKLAFRQPAFGWAGEKFTKDKEYIGENAKFLSDNWSLAGRLTLAPINEEGQVLHLGGSYIYQETAKAVEFSTSPEIKLREPEGKKTFSSATIETKHYQVVGAEASYLHGPVQFEGEYLSNFIEKDSVRFSGWHVQSNYILTGESRTYDHENGKFGAIKMSEGKGAWQLAARYSEIDLHNKKYPGSQGHSTSLALNWYVNSNLRITTSWINGKVKNFATETESKDYNLFDLRVQTTF
jgi:phosphate-selective porin OprO and OprP